MGRKKDKQIAWYQEINGCCCLTLFQNSKEKGTAFTRFGSYPNNTPVSFHYFFTNGEADTRACIFIFQVQALEEDKNSVKMFLLYANAVVAYAE